MSKLTENDINTHLAKMEHSFERGVSAINWMGIEVSWQRKPKKDGGNTLRNKTWGCWEYHDVLTGKELSRSEAIQEILKPFEERRAKVDLTNIKYCGVCNTIAVGEEEQFLWGSLSYVYQVRTYKKANGDTISKFPHHKTITVCRKCCVRILNK